MAFVPSYMGNTGEYVNKGVSFVGQPIPAKELSLRHQQANLSELHQFCSQPTSAKSNVIWDISVLVNSQAPLTRLACLNHSVDVSLTENKHTAQITLQPNVRDNVPNHDFVLLFRDEMVNKPTGLVKVGAGGDQAVSLQVLPDFLSVKERAALVESSKAL